MPAPTLDDLLSPETPDDALSFLLTQLASEGIPTTSYASGGRVFTLLKVFAQATSNFIATIATVARGGLLGLSTGTWLTLLAKEAFEVARGVTDTGTVFAPNFAVGTVTLSVSASAGPYTVSPYASILFESLTGRRYVSQNASSVTLPAGPSSTIVIYKAESPGAAYNAALGQGIGFTTPLPGVTAAFTDTTSTGTWLTTFGADDETDEALRIRCRTKWATLGLLKPFDAYIYLAMNTPGVGTAATKVYVDGSNPRGPGTLDVWLASLAGPLPTADETLIRAYLVARKSPSANLQVQNATAVLITITLTLQYQGGFGTASADASDSVKALINETPIGGKLYLSQILDRIMNIAGVVNVPLATLKINGSNADLQLTPTQVAVFFAWSPTLVIV